MSKDPINIDNNGSPNVPIRLEEKNSLLFSTEILSENPVLTPFQENIKNKFSKTSINFTNPITSNNCLQIEESIYNLKIPESSGTSFIKESFDILRNSFCDGKKEIVKISKFIRPTQRGNIIEIPENKEANNIRKIIEKNEKNMSNEFQVSTKISESEMNSINDNRLSNIIKKQVSSNFKFVKRKICGETETKNNESIRDQQSSKNYSRSKRLNDSNNCTKSKLSDKHLINDSLNFELSPKKEEKEINNNSINQTIIINRPKGDIQKNDSKITFSDTFPSCSLKSHHSIPSKKIVFTKITKVNKLFETKKNQKATEKTLKVNSNEDSKKIEQEAYSIKESIIDRDNESNSCISS